MMAASRQSTQIPNTDQENDMISFLEVKNFDQLASALGRRLPSSLFQLSAYC